MNLKFSHANAVKEHHGKPIYCVAFNTYDPENQDLLASVGGHQATVYRCLPNGGIEVVQVYVDDHNRTVNVEFTASREEFFCCKWSMDKASKDPLLLLAGKLALVRVINCTTNRAVATLKGHGKEVNDICVHPQHPHIILTASKDHSIRLWNISSACCVLLMRGPGAHVGEVFTLDFHPWDPYLFVSGAMDSAVKVWSIKEHWSSISASEQWTKAPQQQAFPVALVAHPIFSSRLVHDNYVDCCRWVGDLVLSKSIDCKVKLWQPLYPENRLLQTGSEFETLRVFEYTDAGSMWWVRFSTDPFGRVLACGNTQGNTYVWDLASPTQRRPYVLRHRKCDRVVRQTAVSMDGSILVSSTEDGILWRWDRQGQQQQQQLQPTSSKRNSGVAAATAAAAAAVGGRGDVASRRRLSATDAHKQDQRLPKPLHSHSSSSRSVSDGSSSSSDAEQEGAEPSAAEVAVAASPGEECAAKQQQPCAKLKAAASHAEKAAVAAGHNSKLDFCNSDPVPPPAAAAAAAATSRKKPRVALGRDAGGAGCSAAAATHDNDGLNSAFQAHTAAAAATHDNDGLNSAFQAHTAAAAATPDNDGLNSALQARTAAAAATPDNDGLNSAFQAHTAAAAAANSPGGTAQQQPQPFRITQVAAQKPLAAAADAAAKQLADLSTGPSHAASAVAIRKVGRDDAIYAASAAAFTAAAGTCTPRNTGVTRDAPSQAGIPAVAVAAAAVAPDDIAAAQPAAAAVNIVDVDADSDDVEIVSSREGTPRAIHQINNGDDNDDEVVIVGETTWEVYHPWS